MTVFIRNKNTGKVSRYALIGNVGYADGRIVLAKDPRISATVYRLSAEAYEIIRVTETQLETPESVREWVPEVRTDHYIETVFEEA